MATVLNIHDHRKVLFTVAVDSVFVTVATYAAFHKLCYKEGISWGDVEIVPSLDNARISVKIEGDLIERKNTIIRLLHEANILLDMKTEGTVVPLR